MPKIPFKILKHAKGNWKEYGSAVGTAFKYRNDIKEYLSDIHINSRKVFYDEYKENILKELNNKNRVDLSNYRVEVETFIEQIHAEKDRKFNVKKPIHDREIKKWRSILIQIENRINIKDYQEYRSIYNNPKYESEYFKGNEKIVDKYRKILSEEDQQKLLKFLSSNTRFSEAKIKRDFFLE